MQKSSRFSFNEISTHDQLRYLTKSTHIWVLSDCKQKNSKKTIRLSGKPNFQHLNLHLHWAVGVGVMWSPCFHSTLTIALVQGDAIGSFVGMSAPTIIKHNISAFSICIWFVMSKWWKKAISIFFIIARKRTTKTHPSTILQLKSNYQDYFLSFLSWQYFSKLTTVCIKYTLPIEE